eukprot:TRINITY_DN9621_c0_g1_i1.p1 TRINITY_DN9621_c0_g1~~TRINITY_DN9621_c0_g1_i1.p1  ORF type:complete len:398 (+),score=81.85 TRINITY_DN9621_c0_g1_i1:97-1194(+)
MRSVSTPETEEQRAARERAAAEEAAEMEAAQKQLHAACGHRYTLTHKTGEGSFGAVWVAETQDKGQCAVKQIHHKRLADPKQAMYIQREISLLQRFSHTFIMSLQELVDREDESGRAVFLVMELADMDLDTALQANEFLPPCIKAFTYQILVALLQLHAARVVHRDLKPGNILVMRAHHKPYLKLTDFGISRECIPGAPMTAQMTTIWYRAPEVLLGFRDYGTAVDMWSMGAVLAEMFTRTALFAPPEPQRRSAPSNTTHTSAEQDESNQITRIVDVVGRLDDRSMQACAEMGMAALSEVRSCGIDFNKRCPRADKDARDLIRQLLQCPSELRPTAEQALAHEFVRGIPGRDEALENVTGVQNLG